jgi:hypothetical protein
MWEPWHLTNLWASTACYRDSSTFLLSFHYIFSIWYNLDVTETCVQQLFYCCMCIRCHGNVCTKLLPGNGHLFWLVGEGDTDNIISVIFCLLSLFWKSKRSVMRSPCSLCIHLYLSDCVSTTHTQTQIFVKRLMRSPCLSPPPKSLLGNRLSPPPQFQILSRSVLLISLPCSSTPVLIISCVSMTTPSVVTDPITEE